MLKKSLTVLGLVAFFAVDDVLLVVLFSRIGFPRLSVALWVLIAVFLVLLNVSLALVVYRVILKRPTTGKEGLVGATGAVVTSEGTRGKVLVRGEHWDADFAEELRAGDEVVVTSVKGLRLAVRPAVE